VPLQQEIVAMGSERTMDITMHDGSVVRFRRMDGEYDPTDREAAYRFVRARQREGELATGLLYLEEGSPDMHGINRTVGRPLAELPYQELCPGNAALQTLLDEFR
jgi:2-oxoglutarate ferredoxin oxidoreductase subunit beta